MTERPLAELHADAINVHLTFDGAFAALGIVNGSQAYIVSLPRDVLEEFIVRAVDKLVAAPLPRGAEQISVRPLAQPRRQQKKGIMSKRFPAYGLLLGAILATGVGIGYTVGAQPHMKAAIGFLQSARRTSGGYPEQGRSSVTAIGLIRPGDQ